MALLRSYGWLSLLLAAYLLCAAFVATAHLSTMKPALDAAVGYYVARQTLFFAVWLFLLTTHRPDLPALARTLAPVWALFTWCGYSPLYNLPCGAAFCLCLLPFQRSFPLACLTLSLLFHPGVTGSATPAFVLGAMGVSVVVFTPRYRLWGILAAAIAAIWATFHLGAFHESDRWHFYQTVWRFVVDTASPATLLFGHGLGSFQILGPIIGKTYEYPGPIWQAMHSDALQSLFELGVVGWTLFAALITRALFLLPIAHRTSLVGMLAFGTFYFPMAIPACLLWGMALVLQGQEA